MPFSPTQYFKMGQKQRCPNCDVEVVEDAINIKEGVALCSGCGTLTRLSELVYRDRPIEDLLSNPPGGCSLEESGRQCVATVSTRSIGSFLTMMCASLFWNGIVSVFLTIAIGGLWANLIGPLPEWFPATENGHPQMNDGPMTLGMTFFLCLFLVPFVAVGSAMIFAMAMSLWGGVKVVVDKDDSYVATGVGILSWKRGFNSGEVTSVKMVQSGWKAESERDRLIEIDSDKLVRFGTVLKENQLYWLKATLCRIFKI